MIDDNIRDKILAYPSKILKSLETGNRNLAAMRNADERS